MVAHVKSRGSEMDIALQIAESDVEVILGGGWDYFLPLRTRNIDEPFRGGRGPDTASLGGGKAFLASGRDLLAGERETLIAENPRLGADGKPYGRRKDKRNLVDEMEKRGYRFVRTASELYLATVSAPEKVLGLFHSGAMPKASEGRTPSLSAMSLAALRVLARSPRGFFLMIEGSQVDWGGHANDFDYAVQEAADFDDALAAVQRFLKDEGIMDETLVVVTADHETGGLSLPAHPLLSRAFEPKWTTKSHTGIPVPVFACGPDAASFGGIQTHELLGRKLVERVAGRKIVFSYPETRRTPQPRAGDGPRTAGKF
jgi:alkaline phosphatase